MTIGEALDTLNGILKVFGIKVYLAGCCLDFRFESNTRWMDVESGHIPALIEALESHWLKDSRAAWTAIEAYNHRRAAK